MAVAVWKVCLAGVVVLAVARGGTSLGTLPPDAGAAGLTWGTVAGSVVAVVALWLVRARSLGRPAAAALAAMAALLAWTGLSILWASAPDRAWLTANRMALALAALVIGVCLARAATRPAERLAIGLAAAAAPVLLLALASRVLPELLSPSYDGERLAFPFGHANGLALFAVLAVPGGLVLATAPRGRALATPLLGLALLVLALTGSRSGVLALVAALAIGLWLIPGRTAMLAALAAGALGAAPAIAYGLAADPFGGSPLPDPSDRRVAGLVLGAAAVVGLAAAIGLRDLLEPAAHRVAAWSSGRTTGRVLLAAVTAAVVAGGVLAVLAGRDTSSGSAGVSLDPNNRAEWWREAWAGFSDAPLRGHGAGSFVLTHIAERDVASDALRVRQPHQLALELLTELGVVGLVLALGVVAAVAWGARRAGRASAPAVCVVVPFLVQAQLDIPWTIAALAAPAMAAAGVIAGMGPPVDASRGGTRLPLLAAAGGVALAVTASAIVLAVASDRAGDAYLDPSPRSAVDTARSATSLDPFGIGALLVEADRLVKDDPAGAVRAATRATRRQPENPFAWECLAAVGDGAARAEALARLARLDPKRNAAQAPGCHPSW